MVRYNVHRSTTAGFTPSLANRIAQPTGTSYTDTVAAGTYYYKVTAEDAAGNVGPASNEAAATVGDTQAPSAPGTLSATGRSGRRPCPGERRPTTSACSATTSTAAHGSGFTPSLANRIAQPTRHELRRHDRARQLLLQGHRRRRGRQHRRRLERGRRHHHGRHDRAQRPERARRTGDRHNRQPQLDGSSDNVGVVRYNVHRGSERRLHPRAGNRIAQPTGTSYADSGLATGTYYYKVTAEDAAGNISAASNEATATVADATPPSAPGTLTATATG